ncbi:MlaD family protein [Cloacibacterium rupense]|nr:MlaD family protein [Cloacibacterium rupense]
MRFTREIKAGLIALLAIVGFFFLFQFMKGKSLFTTDNIYYAKFDNVEGLEQSNPISINGLKVGQVEKIIPQTAPDGKLYFVVKLLVDKQYSFSKNSKAEIFEPGIMSGKELRIRLVYDKAPLAKDGDTLQGAYQSSLMNSLSSQVGPVKDQLQSVLTKVDSAVASANKMLDEQNRREIKALLMSLNQTVASFKATSESTNKLISSNQKGIEDVVSNANETMKSAKNAVDKYGKVAENIDTKKLNQTVEKLSEVSGKLNAVIAGIENGQGSLGKLTKDEALYNNLNETSTNLNLLIKDLKENPKRYINISVFGKK